MTTQPNERWTWLHAVNRFGPNDAEAQLLSYAFAVHFMDEKAVCFPSRDMLAFVTRRSLRTVDKAIALLRDGGWLLISKRRRAGRAHHINEYAGVIPYTWFAVMHDKKWRDVMTDDDVADAAASEPEAA